MGTSAATIAHLLDTLGAVNGLSARKMFGEYAVYLDSRVVALVCDDQLFVKPTPGARAALPEAAEAMPYPGARPHLLATGALDDPDRLGRALAAVAGELPPPKPKKTPRK
jgi:TfoX/Sxy family transcriptional regulator of competence genes